jgi:predicted alpha/beta hydrolase family esterase
MQAAHRETLNEAAIRVEIKGILRVEHSVYGPTHARMRVVMYAEPIDNEQVPKRVADNESEEARWVTLEDLKKLARTQPGLRGPELYEWGAYIEKGGEIAPMHFLCREDEPVPQTQVSYKGESPSRHLDFGVMIESIERGDEAMLERCVLAGVNVLQTFNDKMWTPLHLACKLNQEACVTVLLIAGAEVSAQTHKRKNVLHFAAQSTPAILTNVLICISALDNRLDLINQQDSGGDTPLHFAAIAFGKSFVWELLTSAGADSSIKNGKMQSAEDLSMQSLVLA